MLVLLAGGWLWSVHARAWGLGGRSPVLGYDAAQYALAARALAERGRLETDFALPIELERHPSPPWPLAAVQPGLVIAEAAVDRLVPSRLPVGPSLATPREREWLSLVFPLVSFLGLACLLAVIVAKILRAGGVAPGTRWTAGTVAALAFVLDPEAQHFAAGGFTELPFTLGLVAALALVASGAAARRPFVFGILLGVTGAFRANMLWLIPCFAVAVAAIAPRSTRWRAMVSVLLGYALPLAPWWLYKWSAFGSPGADLSRWMLWEGVEGRTWFTMMHLPESPQVPTGLDALRLLAEKIVRNSGVLLLAIATGPRALWIGGLAIWLLSRPPRALAAAGWLLVVQLALGVLAAAATIPWQRYVFPARVPVEVAGLLATWALVARLPAASLGPAGRRVVMAGIAVLALAWGVWQCEIGLGEARSTSAERGIPADVTLEDLSRRLDPELSPDETVMSNLGPTLAWHARRPVLHLALAPEDLETCRARLTFTHVLLVFRDAEHAWTEWREPMEPGSEVRHPEWNVTRARRWRSADGFSIVWFELGPPRPRLAISP